jgi:hypothetical protein
MGLGITIPLELLALALLAVVGWGSLIVVIWALIWAYGNTKRNTS